MLLITVSTLSQSVQISTLEICYYERMMIRQRSRLIITIGWLGTILLFLAYGLNAWGYIDSTGVPYACMNLIAALFLGIRVYADRNWSNLVLEIFWMGIGIVSLLKYFFL